ncbi:MAG: hypothetical protein ACRENI_09230 [Gemmatimonadaceae bacterium]
MTISTAAAIFSIMTLARAWGMAGDGSPYRVTLGSLGARWVGVSPAADTAYAVGDTMHLAATVTGRNGTTLVGADIGWTSVDPGVAVVDENGAVIARGGGATTIVAAVGKLVARARVVVLQRVTDVSISGDSSLTLSEGESWRLLALPRDGRGNHVRGRNANWISRDTSVLVIDSAGVARALLPGRTTVSVTVDGVAASAPLTVAALPVQLLAIAGLGQSAAAGAVLPQQIVVRIMDARGNPVPAIPVSFRAAEGDGAPSSAEVFTDATGTARTAWVLGDLPGSQALYVSATRMDSALVVSAEAEPTARNTIAAPTHGARSARVGERLGEPVGFRLTDSLGRALAGVPVAWTVLDGGSIAAAGARTDSLGVAHATWTLGLKAGRQRAQLRIGQGGLVPPAVLTALALSGPPAVAEVVHGDGQRAAAGEAPREPVRVRVMDVHGNPVPATILRVEASDGSLADSTALTDSLGGATLRWMLSRSAGPQTLTVRVDGMQHVVTVRASAHAGAPANITFGPLPAHGARGRTIPDSVIVTVTDIHGNTVAGAKVKFSVRTGSVSPTQVATDATGRARARWKLGSASGEQTLTASVRTTDVTSSASVQAVEPPATAAETRPAKTRRGTIRPSGGRS